jgi:hypothetical protein
MAPVMQVRPILEAEALQQAALQVFIALVMAALVS